MKIDDTHYPEYISERLPNIVQKPSSITPHLADKFLESGLDSLKLPSRLIGRRNFQR